MKTHSVLVEHGRTPKGGIERWAISASSVAFPPRRSLIHDKLLPANVNRGRRQKENPPLLLPPPYPSKSVPTSTQLTAVRRRRRRRRRRRPFFGALPSPFFFFGGDSWPLIAAKIYRGRSIKQKKHGLPDRGGGDGEKDPRVFYFSGLRAHRKLTGSERAGGEQERDLAVCASLSIAT